MLTTTATSLRKDLFQIIEAAVRFIPTRIHYKTGDAIILSYQQYLNLKRRTKTAKRGKKLRPLLAGKVRKPLNEKAEEELMRYMGL